MEEIASLSQLQKSILETSKLLENRHPLHKCVLCTQIEKLQDNYYTFREERTWGRWLPRAIISIPSMDLHLIRQTKNKLQGRPKKKINICHSILSANVWFFFVIIMPANNLRLLTTTVYEKLLCLYRTQSFPWHYPSSSDFEEPKHIDIVDSDRSCIIYYKLNIKHHYREDDTPMLFVIITK